MRYLNLKDDKQWDAKICFEPLYSARKETNSSEYKNQKILKEICGCSGITLLQKFGNDSLALGTTLLSEDLDVDFEATGKFIEQTSRVFVNQKNEVVFNLDFEEQIISSEEEILEKRPFEETEANILNESLPVKCTGLTISKWEAARRYVFTKHYRLRHINGLTFDFLRELACRLEAEKLLMFAGGGAKGTDPIVLQKGGKKYRGFLEGRTTENGYLLLLHLTEIDLEDF